MEKLWSILLHFGTNMWNEEGNVRFRENEPDAVASSTLRFSRPLLREIAEHGRRVGMNAIILDIGEGLRYETHPELAVNGSWSRDEMEAELVYLRDLGYEVIPKLNFSACHDIWLGEYSRMLSTSIYYKVCADLIGEVCDIFKPKYFHLGMDEEVATHQRGYDYCVIRQFDLWWHDLYFYIDCLSKAGARPWIWSDYMWNHPDTFLEKCPRDVIQSNWYYDTDFVGESDGVRNILGCFDKLEQYGFDQVPTGSNYGFPQNMEGLTKFCASHISDEHLLGFMQTPWVMTHEGNGGRGDNRTRILESVDQLGRSRAWFDAR